MPEIENFNFALLTFVTFLFSVHQKHAVEHIALGSILIGRIHSHDAKFPN